MKHTLKTHDLFICHASEDKDIVRKLAHILEQHGLSVWLDETMLKVGDSLRKSIDKALATCAYGLVVLSPHFFGKEWPERELDGLTARETSEGRKVIFPIWHNISVDKIRHYSPTLADKIGLPTSRGLQEIAAEIVDEIRSYLGKSFIATQVNKRKKLSHNVEAEVLTASKKKCAIYYSIDEDLQESQPMTPHEEFIKEHKTTIASIISRWIPKSDQHFTQKYIEAIKWFTNFKPSQYALALMLLEKIQYISDQDIRGYIETSAEQIKKIFNYDLTNVLFYPLGDSSASSGSRFLYEYGKELGLKNENFKSDDFRSHLNRNVDIVFFDDIIGSGNQAAKFFNKNLTKSKAKCYYIALLGFEDGIKKIKRDAGFQNLVVCKHLSDEEMAFSDTSWVFKDPDQRHKIEVICQEYGKKLYPDHPLGYDNSQALIVLPYNTPNNTLPVIWAGPKSESNAEETWHPIWARKKRLKQEKKQDLLDGALIINQRFLSNLEKREFLPYQFYTSKLNIDCQWYGIIQQWDSRRNILDDLINQIIESFDSHIDMRVSAVR